MSHALRIVMLLACSGLSLPAQSWEALSALAPGDKIKVADAAGRQHHGRLNAVSNQSLSLETGRGIVEIERARVSQVQVRASSRRMRNILIGAGIGLALGVAFDQTAGRYLRNETGESAGTRTATYVAPIALFAGIGAALSPYRTIYRAR